MVRSSPLPIQNQCLHTHPYRSVVCPDAPRDVPSHTTPHDFIQRTFGGVGCPLCERPWPAPISGNGSSPLVRHTESTSGSMSHPVGTLHLTSSVRNGLYPPSIPATRELWKRAIGRGMQKGITTLRTPKQRTGIADQGQEAIRTVLNIWIVAQ